MNHSGNKAITGTWRPFRTGAFFLGLAMALGACQREEDKETTSAPPTTPTTPAEEGTTTPIRDVDSIVTAPDRTANLNRQAELTNTSVQRVATDRVFWIGAAADRAIPVYIDDEARRSLPADQQRLNAGDRVTVIGEIRRAPSTADLERQWKLTAQDAEQVNKAQVYIHAQRITLLEEEPAMPGEPATPGEPAEQPKEQPGQPGGRQPGGQQPGGQPGGQQPGQPGGQQPGQPGGRQPSGQQPSGQQPSGQQPGQSEPDQSGEFRPGQPSLHQSGQQPGKAQLDQTGQQSG